MVDVLFSLYGRLPRNFAAFVADSLHTLRELGLRYATPAVPGRYLYQARPHGETVVVEAGAGRARTETFEQVVERVKGAHWPHVWMSIEVPREETATGERSSLEAAVVVSARVLPRVDSPARFEGSPFYEVTLSVPFTPLVDVEREEDAEQGLFWFVTQVFLPFFISREALYARADFDPSGAREVTVRHLEKGLIPDFYFLNVLGPALVKKFGLEPFQNPLINPPALQRKWIMRTPEGALLFRAKVEADRWNGPDEPPVDFYDWQGRLLLLDRLEAKRGAKGAR